MSTKLVKCALLLTMLLACKRSLTFEELSAEYQKLENKNFDRIYALNQKAKKVTDDGAMEKLNDEYTLISSERQRELEKFLKKFENLPQSEELLILKVKTLIELNRALEAEHLITQLKKLEKPRYLARTKFEEIKINLIKGDYQNGLKIFKEIEAQIEKDAHYYNVLMLLATNSENPQDILNYGRKFIETRDLPEQFWPYRERVFSAMAEAEKKLNRLDEAQGYLQKAIAITDDLRYRDILEKQFQQVKILQKESPAFNSNFSLNTFSINWAKAQKGITLLYFWAGWSESSHRLFYAINEVARIYQARGVNVIGISKYFGKAFSDGRLKTNLDQNEETMTLRTTLRQNNIVFPCVIDPDGNISKNFGIYLLPTLVVIDKKGVVAEIHNGFFDRPKLEETLRKWLEEK